MKETYVAPQLELWRFLSAESLATFGQNTMEFGSDVSTGEALPGDFNEPVTPGEDLF